jgi:hypothetical protein
VYEGSVFRERAVSRRQQRADVFRVRLATERIRPSALDLGIMVAQTGQGKLGMHRRQFGVSESIRIA